MALWSKLESKGDGTGGQSIWHDKDKTKDRGTGFKMKSLLTYTYPRSSCYG